MPIEKDLLTDTPLLVTLTERRGIYDQIVYTPVTNSVALGFWFQIPDWQRVISESLYQISQNFDANFTELNFYHVDDANYEMTKDGFLALSKSTPICEFIFADQRLKKEIIAMFDEQQQIADKQNLKNSNAIFDANEAEEELGNLLNKYIDGATLQHWLDLLGSGNASFKNRIRIRKQLDRLYLQLTDGCLFIGDRCPLVDYDTIKKYPSAINDIPIHFSEIRHATMIRLYESKIDADQYDPF